MGSKDELVQKYKELIIEMYKQNIIDVDDYMKLNDVAYKAKDNIKIRS